MKGKIKEAISNISIKHKFIIGITSILITAIPVISIVFITQSQNLLIESLEDNVDHLKKNFSIVSKNAIRENSYVFLQELIKEVVEKDRELKALVICDMSNTVLASSDNDRYQIFSKFGAKSVEDLIKSAKNGVIRNNKENLIEGIGFIYAEPLPRDAEFDAMKKEQQKDNKKDKPTLNPEDDKNSAKNKDRLGFVYVSLTTEFLMKEIVRLWIFSGIFTILLLGLGIAWAYWLGFSFTKPILGLADKVRQIALGDLNVSIKSDSRDELGTLITDVEEMRVSIKDLKENLETKVKERTVELSDANIKLKNEIEARKLSEKKLSESNKELEDFAFIASHDLQEPLRKIISFGERFKDKYNQVIDEKGIDYLNRMQNASKRMQALINDLLKYSRVTTKAEPFRPVDLSQIAANVLSDLEVRIEETAGNVEVNNLPTIDADPLQMRQLFQNLIGNGLKYHRKDVPPVIKINSRNIADDEKLKYPDMQGHDICEITVEDNGIGFDEKNSDKIFGIFCRLVGKSEYEGTGVGLAICKKIVKHHRGAIIAKSRIGEGSAFVITIPIKQTEMRNS